MVFSMTRNVGGSGWDITGRSRDGEILRKLLSLGGCSLLDRDEEQLRPLLGRWSRGLLEDTKWPGVEYPDLEDREEESRLGGREEER